MPALRGHFHQGQVVLDDPSDWSEGDVVAAIPMSEFLAVGGDLLGAEERERLHRSIDRGMADAAAGRTRSAQAVLDALRARAAAR